ncbi:MAG TPA: preprotein translocase subunit SecE [Microbacteriaceae bacterium]|nr:preprotein translocase subunit SecE [Microbacteriaceae bacterium]
MARRAVDEPGEDVVARRTRGDAAASQGFFARIIRFFHEVMAELRKVTTPTRSELVNFTIVVLAFVIVMVGIVALFDWIFGMVVVWAFGGS